MFPDNNKKIDEPAYTKYEPSVPVQPEIDSGDKIVNTLTDDIHIEGTMRFSKPTKIDCTFLGNITTESTLILGTKGTITGNLKVGNVTVEGTLKGNIDANNKVILKNTCSMVGDIACPLLTMHEGCKYAGTQSIGNAKLNKDKVTINAVPK